MQASLKTTVDPEQTLPPLRIVKKTKRKKSSVTPKRKKISDVLLDIKALTGKTKTSTHRKRNFKQKTIHEHANEYA